ncbi:MAG: nicotinamide riboside transporter PnuC [Ginsengibacter sp.]
MTFSEIYQHFIINIRETGPLEFIAVISGIISVWYSRKENILVYPTGLINTTFYIYLSFKGSLFGEATVNLYYTIMSVYGWYLWTRKNQLKENIVLITFSNKKDWVHELTFFAVFYVVIYSALSYLKREFAPGVIPWADALASASAFTAMWLMARKKVNSWPWWVITNITSIPLYFVKDYVFTSVYYLILLAMAFWGWVEWTKRARAVLKTKTPTFEST